MKKTSFLLVFLAIASGVLAQDEVPDVYSSIHCKPSGKYYLEKQGKKIRSPGKLISRFVMGDPELTLENMYGNPQGTSAGILLDFKYPGLKGTLVYGFIPYGDSRHPMPVYRMTSEIKKGKAFIDIAGQLGGIMDFIDWQHTGQGVIGYRVIERGGRILYDGKVAFQGTGPFQAVHTITEGPFINNLTHESAVVSFRTSTPTRSSVIVGEKTFSDSAATMIHEIIIRGMEPGTKHHYTVVSGQNRENYSFRTAPRPGSREPFVFAYASDSRHAAGGGERRIYGSNAYVMKKIMAVAMQNEVAFLQFTGDMINGYLNDPGMIELQYANWKRSIEAFAHYFPVYAGMGNHEVLIRMFIKPLKKEYWAVDRFPFETESSEAVFAGNFVNPRNGPVSEDGSMADPDPEKTDFPPYSENVYSYTYGNAGMIVLNSNYFYAPTLAEDPVTDGNLHGYIMDNQMEWMKNEVRLMEKRGDIDHIFVTVHTPFFPNGGHSSDDMWYKGNNAYRPYVAGQPLEKGIIERRDELLEFLVNKSKKVVALLTGDEHNYNRLKICNEMERYPEDYPFQRLGLIRTIYQINNGAAGAPYYAQEELPWSDFVSGFTTQNALVLVYVDGPRVSLKVINPDTLELVDEAVLRE